MIICSYCYCLFYIHFWLHFYTFLPWLEVLIDSPLLRIKKSYWYFCSSLFYCFFNATTFIMYYFYSSFSFVFFIFFILCSLLPSYHFIFYCRTLAPSLSYSLTSTTVESAARTWLLLALSVVSVTCYKLRQVRILPLNHARVASSSSFFYLLTFFLLSFILYLFLFL